MVGLLQTRFISAALDKLLFLWNLHPLRAI